MNEGMTGAGDAPVSRTMSESSTAAPLAPFALTRHALGNVDSSACPVPLAVAPLQAFEIPVLAEAFACMEPWSRYPVEAEALARYLEGDEPGAAPRFAVKAGEQTVGVAGFRLDWLRGPYLQFLAMVPQAQGFGMGSLVIEWMEKQARAAGDGNLWVCASAFNSGALDFYERHGFVRVADLPGLLHPEITEVLMRKRLG